MPRRCVLFKTRDYLPTFDRQRAANETRAGSSRVESNRVESCAESTRISTKIRDPVLSLPLFPPLLSRHSMIYRNICRALFFSRFIYPFFFFVFFFCFCFHFDGGESKISVENAGNFSRRDKIYGNSIDTRALFARLRAFDRGPDKERALPR